MRNMFSFLREWWAIGLALLIPIWATKTYDKNWNYHLVESVVAIFAVAMFVWAVSWIAHLM